MTTQQTRDELYTEGFNQALTELAENWIEDGYTRKEMRDRLIFAVDPSERYLDGFIDALDFKRYFTS